MKDIAHAMHGFFPRQVAAESSSTCLFAAFCFNIAAISQQIDRAVAPVWDIQRGLRDLSNIYIHTVCVYIIPTLNEHSNVTTVEKLDLTL